MKDIFDKCRFGDFTLNSRIIRTGLWESQTNQNGNLTPEIYERYEKIASSGVGMINTELVSLYPNDIFTPYSHRIDRPQFVNEARKLAEITHKYDVPIIAQVGFVKYNSKNYQDMDVNDLTIEDIRNVQTDFIRSAQLFKFGDFDGIQLGLGNNNFLARFINPFYNKRTDEYGENRFGRVRIVLEMIKVIKKNYGLHVSCKINAFDDKHDGIDENESIEIAKLLEKYGADSIQITKPTSPAFFTRKNKNTAALVDYADRLSKELTIPVVLGGGQINQKQITEMINATNVQFISMQRPFVAEGDFLKHWKSNGNGETRCKTCNNCYTKKSSVCFQY